MIQLQDISTINLTGFRGKRGNPEISRKNYKVIREHGLTDYQKLKDFMDEVEALGEDGKDIICSTDALRRYMLQAERFVELSKYWGGQPMLFEIPSPVSTEVEFNHELVDQNTHAGVLLFGSPFEFGDKNDYSFRKRRLSPLQIYDLKQILTHCDGKGLSLVKTHTALQLYEVPELQSALEQYEKQLARQAKEWNPEKDPEENLFFANRHQKEEMIRPQMKEIATYLKDCASKLVWEEKPMKDIDRIYHSTFHHHYLDVERRRRVIQTFADYTTLEEAEKGLVKTKAIDRFIAR